MNIFLRRSRTKRSKKTYRMVTEVMENYRNEEAGQSSLVLAKAPAVIENHRDCRGRKLWTYLTIKQLRGMWDLISWIVCQIHQHWKIFHRSDWLYRIILKPEFVNQLESLVQKVQGFIFYVFKTMRSKKTSQSIVFHDEFVQVVQCHSIKCGKRNHKYCRFQVQVIYFRWYWVKNPGTVVTQRNNPNNLIELRQSRLAQYGLTILDLGGVGDCSFRLVSHEPSHDMNIHSQVGVQ